MLKCPANYFGKGEDYDLPADVDVLREFERQFSEWTAAHPEDPDGSIALAHDKANPVIERPPKPEPTPTPAPIPIPQPEPVKIQVVVPVVEPLQISYQCSVADSKKLRLELSVADIIKLRNYALMKRCRPRDVVSVLINTYCKL